MAFNGASSSIIARLFRLVSTTGKTLAELTSQTISTRLYAVLTLFHNTVGVGNSVLRWSQSASDTSGYTELVGPTITDSEGIPKLSLHSLVAEAGIAELSSVNRLGVYGATVAASTDASAPVSIGASMTAFDAARISAFSVDPANLTFQPWQKLVLNARDSWLLTDIEQAICSASLTTTSTVPADITGATVTVNCLATDLIEVIAVFDASVVGPGTAVGSIVRNGVTTMSAVQSTTAAETQRGMVSTVYYYVVPTDGAYTFKLQGRSATAGVSSTFTLNGTTLTVKVFSTK